MLPPACLAYLPGPYLYTVSGSPTSVEPCSFLGSGPGELFSWAPEVPPAPSLEERSNWAAPGEPGTGPRQEGINATRTHRSMVVGSQPLSFLGGGNPTPGPLGAPTA